MDPIIFIIAFFMVLGMGLVFGVYAFFNESDGDWFSRL